MAASAANLKFLSVLPRVRQFRACRSCRVGESAYAPCHRPLVNDGPARPVTLRSRAIARRLKGRPPRRSAQGPFIPAAHLHRKAGTSSDTRRSRLRGDDRDRADARATSSNSIFNEQGGTRLRLPAARVAPSVRRLFPSLLCLVDQTMLGRPTVSEILPNDPHRAEQRRDRPHDVHDPHVLRMPEQIERDDQEAKPSKRKACDRKIVEPRWRGDHGNAPGRSKTEP
jgi:hypothetical protein